LLLVNTLSASFNNVHLTKFSNCTSFSDNDIIPIIRGGTLLIALDSVASNPTNLGEVVDPADIVAPPAWDVPNRRFDHIFFFDIDLRCFAMFSRFAFALDV